MKSLSSGPSHLGQRNGQWDSSFIDGVLNEQVGDGSFSKVLAWQTQGAEFKPHNLHKKLSVVAYTCNSGDGVTGISLGLLDSTGSLRGPLLNRKQNRVDGT